jgi:hypothetical protein
MKTLFFCIVAFFGVLGAGPKVIAKFGAPQCPWSEQLKQDVWSSPTFQSLLESAGIEWEEIEASVADKDLPTFILLDASGEAIGSLGYLLISPEKYADLFKEMLSIHTLCLSVDSLDTEELLTLYRKSQLFHMTACQDKLLEAGLAQDTGTSFLMEKYAKVVRDHPRRARKIKQEIRSRKPDDIATEWELALITFQARRDISKAAFPIQRFLRRYGPKDASYVWRCHWVLAEFYRGKNLQDKAEHHARLAAEGAPAEFKEMILTVGQP